MVDPVVSLSASTITVLIATKAFEKTGEKLSESTWNLISGFLNSLRHKDPDTTTAIESVAQQPDLAEQQPDQFGTAALIGKVEEAARNYPEVRQAVQAIADELQYQPNAVSNMTNSVGRNASERTVIGISGASCSGKTWLAEKFRSLNPSKITLFDLDSYYRERQSVEGLDCKYDNPKAIDFDKAIKDFVLLKAGREVIIPVYDFETHRKGCDLYLILRYS